MENIIKNIKLDEEEKKGEKKV